MGQGSHGHSKLPWAERRRDADFAPRCVDQIIKFIWTRCCCSSNFPSLDLRDYEWIINRLLDTWTIENDLLFDINGLLDANFYYYVWLWTWEASKNSRGCCLTPAWGPSPQMNTACHWCWAMVFCENSSEVYGGGKCPRVHEYMNVCFVMFFWKNCAPRANDLPWFSRLILYIHKYIYIYAWDQKANTLFEHPDSQITTTVSCFFEKGLDNVEYIKSWWI